MTAYSPATQQGRHTAKFLSPAIVLVLFVCLFVLRLPSAVATRELNVDESQMLSNAMQYLGHPHFKALDGGGLGPLDSILPAAFLLVGVKPGFIFIHLLATLLISLQVLMAYLTMRRISSEKAAAFGTLLMVLFYGLASDPDLLPYSTELLPSLLCMLGFYAFVRVLEDASRHRPLLLFLCGMALGAAPWGKIQSIPIAGAVGSLTIASIFSPGRNSANRSRRAIELLALGSGAVLPTCVMLAIWAQYWPIRDFWNAYLLGPLAYAGHLSFADIVRNVILIFLLAPLRQLLFVGVLVAIYAAFRAEASVVSARQRWVWSGMLVYLGAGLFTILRVKYPFAHHEIFVVPPLIYVIAALATVPGATRDRQSSGRLVKVSLGLAICVAALLFGSYAARYYRTVKILHPSSARLSAASEPHRANEKIAALIEAIQRTTPVRSLAIWGWAPGVYVLTGMPAATRDSMTQYELNEGSLQPYYRARYLRDLQSSQPDLFVDAAVPSELPKWTAWPGEIGYESDPELKNYIDRNYVLTDQLTLVDGEKPVRFFLRKGSFPNLSPKP